MKTGPLVAIIVSVVVFVIALILVLVLLLTRKKKDPFTYVVFASELKSIDGDKGFRNDAKTVELDGNGAIGIKTELAIDFSRATKVTLILYFLDKQTKYRVTIYSQAGIQTQVVTSNNLGMLRLDVVPSQYFKFEVQLA